MFLLFKRFKKYINLILVIFFSLSFFYLWHFNNLNTHLFNESKPKKNIIITNQLPMVAHAGGIYKGKTYTNSLEALNSNINLYDFFEIDLMFTSDNKLVCTHDKIDQLSSYKKFLNYAKKKSNGYSNCTYESLNQWLINNRDKYIITDIKDRNIDGLRFISENIQNYKQRIIPQIYHPNEYYYVKKLGFKNIIWTVYKYKKSNRDILNFAKILDLYAITMPKYRAENNLATILQEVNINSYVHTINEYDEYISLKDNYNINQIYTDKLGIVFKKHN